MIDLEELSGDVVGPSGAVNNFPAAFDGITGKLIKQITGAIAALHSVAPAADRMPYFTGATSAALATLSAFARTFLDDANGAAMFGTMGATQSAASPGYVKLPNGIIIQWGRNFVASDAAIARPVAFTTAVYVKHAICELAYTPTATRVVGVDRVATLDSITVRFRDVVNGGAVSAPVNGTVGWITIGI
ncbi:hypothetical protein GH789_14450 [Rhizobium pusense]|nr:hypothetical protein [Agrobacterium pusense]